MGNQVRHILIILSFLLLSSPVIGQSEKPQTIIVPTGSLGDISEVRKKMLEKTLESKLDDYFAIVPKELFEEAQEQVFQEMDSDECTEDQCIRMIQELLQVENSFKMDLMYEVGDTQISITWNNQDQKRVEEHYCEGCKTKELRNMIGGLVEELIRTIDSNLDNNKSVETINQYNGRYNIVVFRIDEYNKNYTDEMGKATVLIKNNVMKINNIDNATLKTGDKNYWKTLDARINEKGEIEGVIILDLLYGPLNNWINTDDPTRFYLDGNINSMEMNSSFGKADGMKVLFKLRKLNN